MYVDTHSCLQIHIHIYVSTWTYTCILVPCICVRELVGLSLEREEALPAGRALFVLEKTWFPVEYLVLSL